MRVVLDTNVYVSGVFFSGPPFEILDAWRHGRVTLGISPEILAEHERVGLELADAFPAIDLSPFLELVAMKGEFVVAPTLPEQVCSAIRTMTNFSPVPWPAIRRSLRAATKPCSKHPDTPALKCYAHASLLTNTSANGGK